MAQIKTVVDGIGAIVGEGGTTGSHPSSGSLAGGIGASRELGVSRWRSIFSAIVYVLRTDCQWKALPKEYGSASAVHQHFQDWQRAGFFLQLWRAGLAEYDGMEGIAWEWQSIDGATGKAPLAIECVGPNPTDREKKMGANEVYWSTRVASRCRSSPAGPTCMT